MSAELDCNAGVLEAASAEQRPSLEAQRAGLLQRLSLLTAKLETQRPMVVMAASGIRRLRAAQAGV